MAHVLVFVPAPELTVTIEGTDGADELHVHPGGQAFRTASTRAISWGTVLRSRFPVSASVVVPRASVTTMSRPSCTRRPYRRVAVYRARPAPARFACATIHPVSNRERALLLAAFQAADLAVTQLSPRYGADHLDHLGVPANLRPALPVIKAAAVAALILTRHHRAQQRVVGTALVGYYAAATTFHVLAGDRARDTAPAAACAAVAASLL